MCEYLAVMQYTCCRARSCISLNGQVPKMLFDPDQDLLKHVGKYDLVGTSGVGGLLYDWTSAPLCTMAAGYKSNTSLRQRLVRTLAKVFAAASLQEAASSASTWRVAIEEIIFNIPRVCAAIGKSGTRLHR